MLNRTPASPPSNHRDPGAERLLVIRFSSFGDIVQALGVPAAFKKRFPNAQVDWLVREDFRSLVEPHPQITETISFARKQGLKGLIALSWSLAGRGYTHVYDAHNNVRSKIVTLVFRTRSILTAARSPKFLLRSKDRVRRFLFFNFGFRVLPQPFRGAESFLRPLRPWGLSEILPPPPQFFTTASLPSETKNLVSKATGPRVALAPSAAWEMKRWPIEHWKNLITSWPDATFWLLGGPEDRFIQELADVAPTRTVNLAGKLSLAQSSALLKEADLVIANDTGLLHVADQLGRPTIALIGPTAFGYPSHPNSQTVEIELPCKPCSKDGRGTCKNSLYQRCLVEIPPARVIETGRKLLERSP